MIGRLADLPKVDHAFSCENDVPKSKMLQRNGASIVYKDITAMGREAAYVHGSDALVAVKHCHVAVCGFSCKDWCAIVSYGDEMVEYIAQCLNIFSSDPDAELPEPPRKGSTFPTLMGLLRYMMRYKLAVVILENTMKVEEVLPMLSEMFDKMGTISAIGSSTHRSSRFRTSALAHT